jgi:hypothetical protein
MMRTEASQSCCCMMAQPAANYLGLHVTDMKILFRVNRTKARSYKTNLH